MYHKMGSKFLGTYVEHHDIRTTGPEAESNPPFNRDQVIQRIRRFMLHRDSSEKTGASFYDEGSTDNFRVRACETLTMKKAFAPPFGVLADGVDSRIETKPVQVNAGFEFSGTDESYTLWVVKDSGESVELSNEYVLSPYHHTC